MTVVFSDVGGTIFEGAPWIHLRRHSLWDISRGRFEFMRFVPVYGASRLGLVSETRMRQLWLAGMARVFRGMTRHQLDTMYRETVEGPMLSVLRTDVVERLQAHKADGNTVMLVSGIFTELVQHIADYIGIDGAIGTKMEFTDGVATGRLTGVPCVGTQKIIYMRQFLEENYPQLRLEDCVGYADSYSDRALLAAVGHSVATYPDAKLSPIAVRNGWEIFPS